MPETDESANGTGTAPPRAGPGAARAATGEAPRYVGVAPAPPRWVEPRPVDPVDAVRAAELAELASAATAPVGVLAGDPLPRPSRLVAQYLYPTERFRGEWRKHWIHLVPTLAAAAAATLAAAVLVTVAGSAAAALAAAGVALTTAAVSVIAVVLWVGVLSWAGWQVALWHHDRFILTNKRVMAVAGIVARDVAMMPLQRVTDLKYEQSVLARLLNYGTFVLESAGQDQALRVIPHLPRPNTLYLQVVEEMYEPDAVEARRGSRR